MAIQVAQITGDTVELVFDPEEDDLHVGANLSVVERHEDRGLIVQIIELKAIFSASPLSRRDSHHIEGPPAPSPGQTDAASRPPRRRRPGSPARRVHGLHLAIAKIRRTADPAWHPWEGWIPLRDVIVHRTADGEMLRQCIGKAENPLELGQTLAGEPFGLEIAALDTVNIIAGAKGSGASHLANVFVAELIAHGAPCVVFDTRGTHAGLSLDSQNASKRREGDAAIVHLVAGESLRLGVQQFDLHALLTILRQFGLPRATALYFASHVTRRLVQSQAPADAAPPPSLLGIDDLIHLAHDLESGGQAVVGGAVLSCLEAIKKTQILAAQPAEAMALWNSYAQICNGGALVIDLSRLPIRAQTAVVQALVCLLRDRIERKIVTESTPAPFMFFDDAQPLVTRHFIAEVVTAARQHGLTSFFVTTMATGLDDTLLHEADNLFLLQMVSDADVRHLAKSGLVDQETLHAVVRRLPRYQSMVIGSATGGYPIIFAGGACGGVAISEKRAASLRAPAVATVQRAQTPARTDPSLPLFPDDTPGRAVASESRARRRISQSPQPQAPTLAQLTATWHHVVKRTARRRRILETILSAARPLRIAGSKLVLSFPPQHRFQQELIESDEYRRLLEEELKNTFGVSLEVTTELHPA